MNAYYFSIIVINIIVLFIMGIMPMFNTILDRKQKRGFTCIFLIIAIVVLAEGVTVWADAKDRDYRLVHMIANGIGFSLSPFISILCGSVISEYRRIKSLYPFCCVYLLLIIITIGKPFIFYVDMNNVYTRADYYWIYILAYLISVIYLFIETIILMSHYQIKNRVMLYLVFGLILFGTSIQVIEPVIRISWLCVTFVSIIYYTYCNDLWHQVDGLTSLLNQRTYLIRVKEVRKDSVLIIFDVDDFKEVNDTYGHQFGDYCLQIIGKSIKKAYGKYGLCYRIGGDEFCVILNKNIDKLDALNDDFICILNTERVIEENIPCISIGYAKYLKQDDINMVIEEADRRMYESKECNKGNTTKHV